MLRSRTLFGVGVALALALAFGATSASADTFDLTIGNDAIVATGVPGPYVKVDVTLVDSTHATITFTAYPGFAMTDGSSAAVNVSGSFTASTSDVSESSTIGTAASFNKFAATPGTNSNVDGFGLFNLVLDNNDSFKDAATTITFKVVATGTNSWASAAAVLTPNDTIHNAEAASHIGILNADNSAFINGGTGFVAPGGSHNVVPEPSTMAIAGLGALGFLGYGLRRRSKK